MYLKCLKLLNFRNYEKLEVSFKNKKTIIVGDNAQGKTNLLEAICLLATLSSHRVVSDSEYIQWGKEKGLISGIIDKSNEVTTELDVIINPGVPKVLKVNKIKKNSYNEFLGQLIVVSFSIEDLLLLRGGPKDRRRWVDTAIYQLYPAYYNRLQLYNKIKQQKQALLKSFNKYADNLSSVQINMLESWNEQISVAGSNIVYLREKFLKEIFPVAYKKVYELSAGEDLLKVNYESSLGCTFCCHEDTLPSVEEIKEIYNQRIKLRIEEEIIKGQVMIGPHRDDINFYIGDREAKTFASQGQQRTIVLALKLSELDLIKQALNDEPVLLLDDVLAELDLSRQKFLFESIGSKAQTIITTTDFKLFEGKLFDDIDILKVEKGIVVNG